MKKVLALGAGSVAMATLVGLFACGSTGDEGAGPAAEADASSESLDGAGGGLDATGASDGGAAQTFTVSATVTGLAGSGLVLKDQSGAKVAVTAPPG